MRKPKTRAEAIALIDRAGKRKEFEDGWGRSPEQYFEEYSHKEPYIWSCVLQDLGIRRLTKKALLARLYVCKPRKYVTGPLATGGKDSHGH